MLTYTYSGEIGLIISTIDGKPYAMEVACMVYAQRKVTAVKEVSANSRRESRSFKNRC